ncbi:MAG: chromate transporter [Caulobacteraceae bacterium]
MSASPASSPPAAAQGAQADAAPVADVSLAQLFAAFTRIGTTAFGGGIAGWTMREIVDKRGWMTTDDFLTGMAMSQALPGVNVVNLAIWVGYRLCGGLGAVAAAMGIILPAAAMIACLAGLFNSFAHGHEAHLGFAGAAAAAIGLSLSMALRAGRRSMKRLVPCLVMAATFVTAGLLRVSIIPVVLALGPASVAYQFWQGRRHA